MRELISGRDFQLRYALWRIVRIAAGMETTSIDRVRVEWPVRTRYSETFVDALFEDAAGQPVEIAECKEHDGFIAPESISSFVRNARSIREASSSALRFRFVTNARFLKKGKRTYDFATPREREEVLSALGFTPLPDLEWDIAIPGKSQLLGDCIFRFASGRGDAHDIYARLYTRIASQMAIRGREPDQILRKAVDELQLELLGESHQPSLKGDGTAFSVGDVRQFLMPERRSGTTIARRAANDNLRRNLFEDTNVSLAQVFVDPETMLSVVDPRRQKTALSDGGGIGMLLRWLGGVRDRALPRKPLVVLGPFGSGKSCLLTVFASRVAEMTEITPILVPLRDILGAGKNRSLRDEVERYILEQRGINLSATHPDNPLTYCVICDGFDELNLFYSDRDDAQWVEQCFRDLASMAMRSDLAVIISSRPILFMDLTRTASPADGAPLLEIRPFQDDHIRVWCSNYRRAAGLSESFSWEFLDERKLGEVAETPIVLFMIARVFETAPALLQRKTYTRADIYDTFIAWTVGGGYRADHPKHKVPAAYRQILQEIAWFMFLKGDGIAERGTLLQHLRARFGDAVDDIPVDNNLLVAHMLKPVTTVAGEKAFIEFSHQSFREFLVADRTWRLLEPARKGAGLTVEAWNDVSGRLFTPAKLAFLSDLIERCSASEAKALFDALAHAENIHSYWNEFAKPYWSALASGRSELRDVQNAIETLPVRAIALAVLAFLFRTKALRRLGGRELQTILANSDPIATLERLLHFQSTFPEKGLVAAARDLLVRNLDGLQARKSGAGTGVSFADSRITRADLRECNFRRASFHGAEIFDSKFTGCSFAMSDFTPRSLDQVTFEHCDFTDAFLNISTQLVGGVLAAPGERVIFRRCSFERAYFQLLRLAESTFEDCNWKGAVFAETIEHQVSGSVDTLSRVHMMNCGVDVR